MQLKEKEEKRMNYFATPIKIGRNSIGTPEFPNAQTLLKHLDYLGIDRALVYSAPAMSYSPINGNKQLLKYLEPYRDRLFPVWILGVTNFYECGTLDWIREQMRAGNRAFFINPKRSRFRVRELERILQILDPMNPVIFMDVDLDTIDDIEYVAGRCPGCHFVKIGRAHV